MMTKPSASDDCAKCSFAARESLSTSFFLYRSLRVQLHRGYDDEHALLRTVRLFGTPDARCSGERVKERFAHVSNSVQPLTCNGV